MNQEQQTRDLEWGCWARRNADILQTPVTHSPIRTLVLFRTDKQFTKTGVQHGVHQPMRHGSTPRGNYYIGPDGLGVGRRGFMQPAVAHCRHLAGRHQGISRWLLQRGVSGHPVCRHHRRQESVGSPTGRLICHVDVNANADTARLGGGHHKMSPSQSLYSRPCPMGRHARRPFVTVLGIVGRARIA